MRLPVMLLAVLTTATLVPYDDSPAAASCAAPWIVDADALVLRPGARVDVDGVGFVDGCQDTGSCSTTFGCTSCDHGPAPEPLQDVTLRLRQDGRTWLLGEADARGDQGDRGAVTWRVVLPDDVERGRAVLVPEGGDSTEVRIG